MSVYVRRSAVWPLIGITVVVFFLQLLPGFLDSFILVAGEAFSRPWTLVSTMFLHAGFVHILFNMYGLLLFGSFVESKIGYKKVVMLYFTAGILASVISALFYIGIGAPATRMLGASGAVMGLVGALIMLMPNLRVLLFFAIPMPLWVAGILFFFIDLFNTFGNTGIAGIAHISGMAVGLALGWYFKKNISKVHRVPPGRGAHMSGRDIDSYLKTGRL